MSGDSLLSTESKVIDDVKFDVTMFPGLYGLKIKGRLLKIIGPAFGQAFKSLQSGKTSILDSDIDFGVVGDAISKLCERLDDPAVIQLIKDLLSSTKVDGQDANNDAVLNFKFAGKYTTLYKGLLFVVEVNRFFGVRNIGDAIDSLGAVSIPKKQ